SVEWQRPTVFAGEDVECRITFRNIFQSPNLRPSRSPSVQPYGQGVGALRALGIKSFDGYKARRPGENPELQPPSASSNSGLSSGAGKVADHKHRRSVSIVSLGCEKPPKERFSQGHPTAPNRWTRGHSRTASLQIVPGQTGATQTGLTSGTKHFIYTFFNMLTMILGLTHGRTSTLPSSRNWAGAQSRPQVIYQRDNFKGAKNLEKNTVVPKEVAKNRASNMLYTFRPTSAILSTAHSPNTSIDNISDRLENQPISSYPPTFGDGGQLPNPQKRFSSTNKEITPRSSGDFSSASNKSSEMAASDYLIQAQTNSGYRGGVMHRHLKLKPHLARSSPEVLLMGFGQIIGSFELDGSLVSQTPFEEVKRKGVIGNQSGGGIVRADTTQRETGILRSLGWDQIGESLGNLLKGGEMTGAGETLGTNGTRSIPVLSTPQAVLFVDLSLEPGESKSFVYRHGLPNGIPPTYHGKAMKTCYSLVIGVQRIAAPLQKHKMRHINVPFRVLPSVNEQGDVLGHDLLSPHVIIHDRALISTSQELDPYPTSFQESLNQGISKTSRRDFSLYLNHLLHELSRNSSHGHLTPSDVITKGSSTPKEDLGSTKDAIESAILRSNLPSSSKMSLNRYEIMKSGDRVAVIILTRPACRLGETVLAVIDFQRSTIPCHSLLATLETSETVEPELALRSKASIRRISRRVYASRLESAISADRIEFDPMIPINATPEFVTSGVRLEWSLRFRFVTQRQLDQINDGETSDTPTNLVEKISEDEKGSIIAAVESMSSETIDVSVPLRVYGNTGGLDRHGMRKYQ
ncbi:MAG: hypothetical protein Q9214_005822, partial [Letrouitia sp. 1 TL-2023]